jgi:uncharacterized protein YbjQ (UPF0145 family)
MSPEHMAELFGSAGAGPGAGAGAAAGAAAGRRLARAPHGRGAGPVTSDLHIDETLLLHSVGWEATDLVIGAAEVSVPYGTFTWSTQGALAPDVAARSLTAAMAAAADRLHRDCTRAGGVGVIGVEVEVGLTQHAAHVTLTGTAVAPSERTGGRIPWVSDLSVRDFCLLHAAGYEPLGLAFGTAMVQVPYRSVGAAFKQMTANVELENYTNALYEAREVGMERMQQAAISMQAKGVVAVSVIDRPLPFASHVIGFTAWGTAVRLRPGGEHTYLQPRVTVSLNDGVQLFDIGTAMRH